MAEQNDPGKRNFIGRNGYYQGDIRPAHQLLHSMFQQMGGTAEHMCAALERSPRLTSYMTGVLQDVNLQQEVFKAFSSDENTLFLHLATLSRPENADLRDSLVKMAKAQEGFVTGMKTNLDNIETVDAFARLMLARTFPGSFPAPSPEDSKLMLCNPHMRPMFNALATSPLGDPERARQLQASLLQESMDMLDETHKIRQLPADQQEAAFKARFERKLAAVKDSIPPDEYQQMMQDNVGSFMKENSANKAATSQPPPRKMGGTPAL